MVGGDPDNYTYGVHLTTGPSHNIVAPPGSVAFMDQIPKTKTSNANIGSANAKQGKKIRRRNV